MELIHSGLLPDQFNHITCIFLTSLSTGLQMLLQNLSTPRSKPLEQHREALEILNSSYSDYRKYIPKRYPPNFSAWSVTFRNAQLT